MSQPTQMPMAPAGWYADNGVLRWWDGARWTQNVAPAGPAAPLPPSTAPWPTRSRQRRTVMGIALGLGLGILLALVTGVIEYAVAGDTPTENQDAAFQIVAALAFIAGIIAGCLYGARSGAPSRRR